METTIVILLSIITACSVAIAITLKISTNKLQLIIQNKFDELVVSENTSYTNISEKVTTEFQSILNELKETKNDIVKGVSELKEKNVEKIQLLSARIVSAQDENKKSLEKSIEQLVNISTTLQDSFEESKNHLGESSIMINDTLKTGLENIVDALKETISLE